MFAKFVKGFAFMVQGNQGLGSSFLGFAGLNFIWGLGYRLFRVQGLEFLGISLAFLLPVLLTPALTQQSSQETQLLIVDSNTEFSKTIE